MGLIAVSLTTAFGALALLHIYWAWGGRAGVQKVIPTREGEPVIVPGPLASATVALLLGGLAGLSMVLSMPELLIEAKPFASYAGFVAGAVLVLRSVGDFRYVGFFKRVRGSTFATYDSRFYSPFCLVAGVSFFVLSWL